MVAINQQQTQANNAQRNNNSVILLPIKEAEINVTIEQYIINGCSAIFSLPRSEDVNVRLQQQTTTIESSTTFAVIAKESFL
ncbi:hypothetical protein G9A89_014725 [Geosiphon pyriformis]|nr:hypothetical protein G9A89_014725 [Geosiphon pyriformis]